VGRLPGWPAAKPDTRAPVRAGHVHSVPCGGSAPRAPRTGILPDPRDTERRSGWPVALVCMPFMDAHRPSIQLGLL